MNFPFSARFHWVGKAAKAGQRITPFPALVFSYSLDPVILGSVTVLQRMIEEALEQQPMCFVPPDELERVWPNSSEHRRREIAHFADERDWQVFSYSDRAGAFIMRKHRGQN